MNKKIIVGIVIAITMLFACGKSNEQKIAEMTENAKTWVTSQEAFHAKNGTLGDCGQIGYTLPSGSKFFSYECAAVENGRTAWTARNTADLGDCKTGTTWGVYMAAVGKEYEITTELPEVGSCLDITPEFFKTAKKEASEEAKREQFVIDSIAARERFVADSIAEVKAFEEAIEKDPSQATAELEEEFTKWVEAIRKANSMNTNATTLGRAYTAPPESKLFTYRVRNRNTEGGWVSVWTATSKLKMGDCPARSAWELNFECCGIVGDCGNTHKVAPICKDITPEAITKFDYELGSGLDWSGY